jgi:integrase
MEMWDVETIGRFLEAARQSQFFDLYQLAVLTGMRRSELCGLKWENVNLVAGRASVVQTLQRITGHGLVEGQPKTARSRRSIALSPQAVDLLHTIRGRQIEQQLEAGPLWLYTGYVFTQAIGAPLIPDRGHRTFPTSSARQGCPTLPRMAYAMLMPPCC